MKSVIQNIQQQIKEGFFTNEASVIRGIINPILQELNWPINDVRIVRPEHTIGSQRVDIALFHNNKPFVFIEAKKIGGADGAERQLFEYAFHSGVPILVLTDGPTWHFFLTAGLGTYEQRKVNKLDIIEYDDLDQLCSKFNEYLNYTKVITGKALNILQKDYEDVDREREIIRTLPNAWKSIVDKNDDLLFELVANKVEELCNFKPSKISVFKYLSEFRRQEEPITPPVPPTKIKIKPSGGLGFTRIINCNFGGTNPGNKWANLISTGIPIAIKQGLSINDLQRHTTINLVKGEENERGFKLVPKARISYQGMDANKTWENALKISKKKKKKIYV
ncbi:MAG: type I restriction endonuclease [Ignavibacteriaceae bacterium]|jgi:hypothetical protein|nr:type I restriction endonuclease [Ignavibacteriaceae bacterium]